MLNDMLCNLDAFLAKYPILEVASFITVLVMTWLHGYDVGKKKSTSLAAKPKEYNNLYWFAIAGAVWVTIATLWKTIEVVIWIWSVIF